MKAVVKYGHGDGDVELREVPEPVPAPDEVLVEVKAAGICGSDIDLYHNKQTYKVDVPVILGHEFVGAIVALGANVKDYEVGDRVICETAAYTCGECVYCRSGQYNYCYNRKGFGYGVDGAFTSYVRARAQLLHHMPEGLSYVDAVLVEPVTVTVNALLEDTRIYPADTVAIIGPGTIGLLSVLVAKVAGATDIVVVGRSRHRARLALARELGATATLDSETEDVVEFFKNVGDGLGADLVIDVTGASASLDQALDIVRKNGQITEIGFGAQPLGFSLARLVSKAVRLQGVYSHTYRTWERAIRLVASGQVNATPLVGGHYPLADWHKAIQDVDSGRVIKAVLIP
ncbi:MAG: zinc-binding dehydrogenase [Chloroflexota bacterium]